MRRNRNVPRLAALALLLSTLACPGLLAQALAQPVVPASKASIDPQAKQVFYQISAAYRALHSYTGQIDITEQQSGRKPVSIAHCEVALQSPRQAIARTTYGSHDLTVGVADGRHTLLIQMQGKTGRYCVLPAAFGSDVSNALICGTPSYDLVMVLQGSNLFPYLGLESLISLMKAPNDVVDRVAVTVVVARYHAGPRGPLFTSIAYSVGTKDHLLRRISEVRTENGVTIKRITTFSQIAVNASLPASHFSYTPPPEAVQIATLQEWNAPPSQRKIGEVAPALEARTLDDQPVSLETYRGKVVLLDFWATWCGPCRTALPALVALRHAIASPDFQIVSIAEDQSKDASKIQSIAQKSGVDWLQLREYGDSADAFGPTAKAYKCLGIPYTVLIGRDGRIAAVNQRDKALADAVQSALSK